MPPTALPATMTEPVSYQDDDPQEFVIMGGKPKPGGKPDRRLRGNRRRKPGPDPKPKPKR